MHMPNKHGQLLLQSRQLSYPKSTVFLQGRTALMHACMLHRADVVKLLLDNIRRDVIATELKNGGKDVPGMDAVVNAKDHQVILVECTHYVAMSVYGCFHGSPPQAFVLCFPLRAGRDV